MPSFTVWSCLFLFRYWVEFLMCQLIMEVRRPFDRIPYSVYRWPIWAGRRSLHWLTAVRPVELTKYVSVLGRVLADYRSFWLTLIFPHRKACQNHYYSDKVILLGIAKRVLVFMICTIFLMDHSWLRWLPNSNVIQFRTNHSHCLQMCQKLFHMTELITRY